MGPFRNDLPGLTRSCRLEARIVPAQNDLEGATRPELLVGNPEFDPHDLTCFGLRSGDIEIYPEFEVGLG
ncbi:MAG: hypothetical protein VX815_01645 [Gemmatimonadota bacterium]|nr:hypothetical protein [Gemmatimonadota bacterium]